MSENCHQCVYFYQEDDDLGWGFCRRYAPHPEGSRTPEIVDDQLAPVFYAQWPVVDLDMWCGEWTDRTIKPGWGL